MRFLFDEMLKRLCSWCRILGIESQFIAGKSDSYLLGYAKKNELIMVTRDLQLSLRCESNGVRCILIRSERIDEQIAQLLEESGAVVSFPDKTRCAFCNSELESVPKDTIKAKVPQNVYENHEKFWICRECGKIYWEGGHWANIKRIYDKVKSLMR